MVNLYIEGKLLDQYDDESVDIISSVLDVQDITKNTGDYSKEFSVPSSKNNNKIFKHWYNSSIDNSFDARTRVSGSIDIDGVPFKTGKWLLRSVKIVKGVPDSYKINFYGDTASLSETVGKDVLRNLDLSAFNHAYNSNVVKDGLELGLFNSSIIYPLMAQKRMFYNSNPAATDEVVNGEVQQRNIAWLGDGTGVQYTELRPSIKVIEIIEAIESKYNITFSRDFFGTTEFDELYMWLSPDLKGFPLGNKVNKIDWNTTDGTWLDTTTDIATYTPTVGSTTDEMQVIFKLTPALGSVGNRFLLRVRNVDTDEIYKQSVFVIPPQIGSGFGSISTVIPIPQDTRVIFEVLPTEALTYSATLKSTLIDASGNLTTQIENSSTNATVIADATVEVSKLLPEMEVSEFIKGLIQMFKLIVIGSEGNNFYVNSLDAYYRTGKRHEITKYVDYASMDVQRGELLSELDFKFQEPTTILAKQFLDVNGVGYGDSKVKLKNSNGDAFDGDVLTVELPFETVVYDRLTDENTGNIETAIQVGNVIDINYSPVFIAPHLHYASKININDVDNHIKFNEFTQLQSYVYMPMSHSGVYSPAYSLGFESEISTYTRETLNNTLYSNHYQNYLEAIFNVKRRTFQVSAQLPIQIITRLQLNDIITIDQLDYRINNFKYNLLTGRTQLELINGFDKYNSNDVILPTECFRADVDGGTYSFNIPNIQDYTITNPDVGGRASFITASVDVDNQLKVIVDAWVSSPENGDYSRTAALVFTSIGQNIDVIKNGGFTEGTNGSRFWYANPSNSFTFNNGYAEGTASNGAGLVQVLDAPLVVGCEYLVTYTISDYVSGWIDCYLGGTSRSQTVSSNGIKSQYVTATVASNSISFQSIELGSFKGKISNVSVIGCGVNQEGGMCITQTNQGYKPNNASY